MAVTGSIAIPHHRVGWQRINKDGPGVSAHGLTLGNGAWWSVRLPQRLTLSSQPLTRASGAVDDPELTLTDVYRARAVVSRHLQPTPLLRNRGLSSEMLGCDLWIKYENCTPIRSFKARGGIYRLSTLGDAWPGITSASTGNHGPGMALGAKLAGKRAVIVVPKEGANPVKVAAIVTWEPTCARSASTWPNRTKPQSRSPGKTASSMSRTAKIPMSCSGAPPWRWRSSSRCPTSTISSSRSAAAT